LLGDGVHPRAALAGIVGKGTASRSDGRCKATKRAGWKLADLIPNGLGVCYSCQDGYDESVGEMHSCGCVILIDVVEQIMNVLTEQWGLNRYVYAGKDASVQNL